MLAADNVPAPTAIVLVPFSDGAFIETAPEAVSVLEPVMVMPVAAPALLIVIVAHAAAELTVTVKPDAMITSSPTIGCPVLGVHVEFVFQSVLAAAVYDVAFAVAPSAAINSVVRRTKVNLFMIASTRKIIKY
jgi:hypothetical protein